MAKSDQVFDLVFRVGLLYCKKTVEEADKKLRTEQIVILVDPVEEPAVLENVQNDHGGATLFVKRLVDFHDILAG